jgi:hypothetical protein
VIPLTDLRPREEVFTHVNDASPHTQLTFAVERIYAKCIADGLQQYLVPVERSNVEYMVRYRGIETHRLLRLTLDDLVKPVLFVRYEHGTGTESGSYLLIDGCHRYVKHALEGRSHIHAYVIEDREFWEPFLVDGVEPETLESLLGRPSGL